MNHAETKRLQERIALGEDRKDLMREYNMDYKAMRYHVERAFTVGNFIKKVRRISVSALQQTLEKEGYQKCADHFRISIGQVYAIAKHTGKYFDMRLTQRKAKSLRSAPEITLKIEVEKAEIHRCEWCESDRQPCLNCYSLSLIGRLPLREDFQYIEKRIAI